MRNAQYENRTKLLVFMVWNMKMNAKLLFDAIKSKTSRRSECRKTVDIER